MGVYWLNVTQICLQMLNMNVIGIFNSQKDIFNEYVGTKKWEYVIHIPRNIRNEYSGVVLSQNTNLQISSKIPFQNIHQIFTMNIGWMNFPFIVNIHLKFTKYSPNIHDEYWMNEPSIHPIFVEYLFNIQWIYGCIFTVNSTNMYANIHPEYSWNIHLENVLHICDICHVTYSMNMSGPKNVLAILVTWKLHPRDIHQKSIEYSTNISWVNMVSCIEYDK